MIYGFEMGANRLRTELVRREMRQKNWNVTFDLEVVDLVLLHYLIRFLLAGHLSRAGLLRFGSG